MGEGTTVVPLTTADVPVEAVPLIAGVGVAPGLGEGTSGATVALGEGTSGVAVGLEFATGFAAAGEAVGDATGTTCVIGAGV